MPEPELTERQQEVLDFIRKWWADKGYGPSVREIAKGLSVSTMGAWGHIKRLHRLGVLAYTPKVSRSCRIVQSSTCTPRQEADNSE